MSRDEEHGGFHRGSERDLVLAPNQFALILDETKGHITAYVGPNKTSLANTDRPVIFDEREKDFRACNLDEAKQTFRTAPEGWYIVLKNPSKEGKHPSPGSSNTAPDLDIGHKVNIPGPVSFALWPGQMVRLIPGHRLRSNQYLLVRVYDDEAAKANWKKAVIKPQTETSDSETETSDETPEDASVVKVTEDMPELTMGKLLVIKGNDVSYYMPPTGIEVVRYDGNKYVRDAVTLERLKYCILRDENGNKRYVQGPAVVFPRPTETFIEKRDKREFKAIELNEHSGIYIKVIAGYEEDGKTYKVGDELFITGKECMIYFPREEHAIIRYGNQEVHYAVAIPAGEGRYVLNRDTGEIDLVEGPKMFLADPRKHVIVRRALDLKAVKLMYPGNQEALEVNSQLMTLAGDSSYVSEPILESSATRKMMTMRGDVEEGFVGDDFDRRKKFTQPRTITLNTKYDGAVTVNVWTGYAVLVVSKSGARRVEVGPKTILLVYDETLEAMELSTSKPKTTDRLLKTVYLRVMYNKVSDIISAETKDLCPVAVKVSYRVNFEGESEKWFNVENYVKFLCDHLRSILRNKIKQCGVEEFYADAIDIVRDTILGKSAEGGREGRNFEENGMKVYDVEVLEVNIDDDRISSLLVNSHRSAVEQKLQVAAEQRRLELTEATEDVERKIAASEAETKQSRLDLQKAEIEKRLTVDLASIDAKVEQERRRLEDKMGQQGTLDQISGSELARVRAEKEQNLALADAEQKQRLEELKAEVQAVVDKAKAISPQLVAALEAFGNKELVERVSQAMSPMALLGGTSVADVVNKLLKGTVLEGVMKGNNQPKELATATETTTEETY